MQASKAHLEERLEEALAKCEMTRKELVDVRQLFHSRQQEEDTVDAQARAEKKVWKFYLFLRVDAFLRKRSAYYSRVIQFYTLTT